MDWLMIGLSAIMLFGAFATIRSEHSTHLDYDFALILLIGGLALGLYSVGALEHAMDFVKSMNEPQE